MPKGANIGTIDFSEIRQWTLPDFFSLEDVFVESPRFSLAGYNWRLIVFPKGNKKRSAKGYISVYIQKDDPSLPDKALTFAIGLKRADGLLDEKYIHCRTVNENVCNWGWNNFLDRDVLHKRKSELLTSGALTFTCRMELEDSALEMVAPNHAEAGSGSKGMMLAELETLSSDLKDLLSSESNSDAVLDVQGKEFRAHRALLSSRSSVFHAMFEHDTVEARSGVVTIPDCDPDSFGDFLHFLYTGKIGGVPFHTAYHMYTTANKYNVQQLQDFCSACMKQNFTAENVCDVIVLADRYGDSVLMSLAQTFFNENCHSVFLTPEWTDLSLKNNPRLADRLLKEMASAALKTS